MHAVRNAILNRENHVFFFESMRFNIITIMLCFGDIFFRIIFTSKCYSNSYMLYICVCQFEDYNGYEMKTLNRQLELTYNIRWCYRLTVAYATFFYWRYIIKEAKLISFGDRWKSVFNGLLVLDSSINIIGSNKISLTVKRITCGNTIIIWNKYE